MRTPYLAKALESFLSIMAEKRQLSSKERKMIETLNRAIHPLGYNISWKVVVTNNRTKALKVSRRKNMYSDERGRYAMKGHPKLKNVIKAASEDQFPVRSYTRRGVTDRDLCLGVLPQTSVHELS